MIRSTTVLCIACRDPSGLVVYCDMMKYVFYLYWSTGELPFDLLHLVTALSWVSGAVMS